MKNFVGFLFIVAIIVGILYYMGVFKPTPPVAKGLPDLNKPVFITGQLTDNLGKILDVKVNINNDNTFSFGSTALGFVGKWTLTSQNDEMIKLSLISTSDPNNAMIIFYKNFEATITFDGGRVVMPGKWHQ